MMVLPTYIIIFFLTLIRINKGHIVLPVRTKSSFARGDVNNSPTLNTRNLDFSLVANQSKPWVINVNPPAEAGGEMGLITIKLFVGTPPQEIEVNIDTNSTDLLIPL